MSSNNTTDSPLASPDLGDNRSSFFEQIFISFLALSSLFIGLCLVRCFLQRIAMRNAATLLWKRNIGGLDPAAIATLPTFPYRKNGDTNNRDEENNGSSMECSICLSAVEEGEMVKLLPQCKHSFHGDCVGRWLSGHITCPVCRIEVLGSGSAVRYQPNQVEMVAVPVLDLEGRP